MSCQSAAGKTSSKKLFWALISPVSNGYRVEKQMCVCSSLQPIKQKHFFNSANDKQLGIRLSDNCDSSILLSHCAMIVKTA